MKKTLLFTILIVGLLVGYHYTFADISGSSLLDLWRMDSTDISGTTLTDRGATPITGTITAATKVGGKVGQALSFDGSTAWVDLGDPSSVDFGDNPFTFTAWVYTNSVSAAQVILGKDSDAASGRQFAFMLNNASNGSLTLSFNNSLTTGFIGDSSTGTITAGKWYHVVGQRVSTNVIQLYINGKAVSTTLTGSGVTMVGSATTMFIGKRNYAGFNNPFNGRIDDVRIYNRALSASDVAQLYNLGLAKHSTF